MRVVLILLTVVVGLGLVVVLIGLLLPVKHEATVSATIPAAPEAVWAVLTDPRRLPGICDRDRHVVEPPDHARFPSTGIIP